MAPKSRDSCEDADTDTRRRFRTSVSRGRADRTYSGPVNGGCR